MDEFDSEDRRGSGRRRPGRRSSRPDRRSFSGRDSGRSGGGFNRREFSSRRPEERTMHQVTCDACGESCEVPFKPTEGKPIYCDACFKKNKGAGAESKNNQLNEQLAQINEKLDKILEAIESSS